MTHSSEAVDAGLVGRLAERFGSVAERAAEADLTGLVPQESWKEIVESGYLRVFHPEEIGGLGANGPTQAAAMETLARACAGTYWSATMSTLLCGKLISTHGDVVEHRELLDGLLGGERLGAFAVVERTSGSDAGTYRTTVTPRDGGYVINGEKSRITNAPTADVAVVLARLAAEDGSERPPGWCLAFVDLHQPGVGRYDMPHMGLRAMPWGGITFEDVPIRAQDVVPVPYSVFGEGMAWGWLFISIAAIATAERALRASAEHATSHIAFGHPLGHMDGVHTLLATSRAEIDAARLLARRAAWHRAEGRSARDLIAVLKIQATELAVRVTQHAVQIHGAGALMPGHPVERYVRDAPMNVIGGFTTNRLRELVADGMGLDGSYYPPFDWLAPAGFASDPALPATTTE
ncbi:acyl-CoA dehydrogenase family protein [Streptomyces sp. SP18CS02]|uniref:acyl-CoA dehydrogenase family protein n=1 Tax=Streptomyces sp. SP18CS02 TaxID=3002531 RepID=UPI002E79CE03|nr:acyl-CoA dehydrogenase family protein [Streptomyces sp. SP18CS02]MEE1756445.1 acyl-CoA/acyl-ACP dehydrogenase [Streptomyces sp. SP18CS02]